jgi:hypothetical protein
MTTILIILAYAVGGVVFYLVARWGARKEGGWTIGQRTKTIFAALWWPPIALFWAFFQIVLATDSKSPAKW